VGVVALYWVAITGRGTEKVEINRFISLIAALIFLIRIICLVFCFDFVFKELIRSSFRNVYSRYFLIVCKLLKAP